MKKFNSIALLIFLVCFTNSLAAKIKATSNVAVCNYTDKYPEKKVPTTPSKKLSDDVSYAWLWEYNSGVNFCQKYLGDKNKTALNACRARYSWLYKIESEKWEVTENYCGRKCVDFCHNPYTGFCCRAITGGKVSLCSNAIHFRNHCKAYVKEAHLDIRKTTKNLNKKYTKMEPKA